MNENEFAAKKVVITGVSSGIGKAQAKAFLAAGAQVFGLDKTAGFTELSAAYPRQFTGFLVDLTDENDLTSTVKKVLELAGTVDILLNTAGSLDAYKKTLEINSRDWDFFMNTNVKSMFLLTNLILPTMLAQKAGTIINMASIAGLVAGGGGAAYTASKHAIIGYTKQLALDYAAENIHVNALAPGAIETPMNAADFAGDGAMSRWVAAETPVKRWAQPEEVADATLFLASATSRYLQGIVLPIDGGWTLK